MKIMSKALLALSVGLCFSATVGAQSMSVGNATGSPGGATTPAQVPVTFTRNPAAPVADFGFRVSYPTANLNATVAPANGGSCSVNDGTGRVTVLAPAGQTDIATGVYCNITFTIDAAAPAPSTQNLVLSTEPGGCVDTTPAAVNCTLVNGAITVTGAVTPVGPSIAYNPAAGGSAGTGGPVNFTGVGAVGSTGAGQIVATPSGGAVAGTQTTVGNFTLSGADAANFAVTSAATLTFTQGNNTAQNINMTCTAGAAARTANLQATETITGGATSQRFWVLNCPAGSAAAVPPTITYAPGIGSTTNIAAGASTLINVGCPTDGSACNGSGTGLAATSRLENLRANYSGPMFSPIPTMVCQFVSEAGGAVASPRDYLAGGPDQGDISCTCPANTTSLPNEPFLVQVDERIPASAAAITATRNFTIVCGGPPPVCPTVVYANFAAGSTVNLTNGGAASQVTSVTAVGGSNGVSQTITCATSNVSAGSTFTVTTSPTPLIASTIPALGGTVSAACTNSATTTGTATLTCTGTSVTTGCASTATFTLSCPGQGVPPPPGEFTPVPAMSEQGRILLAALVLLLGLGVVGFRMRG